jgi:hypothetical protein
MNDGCCDLLCDQQLPTWTCVIGNDRVWSSGNDVFFARRPIPATGLGATLLAAVQREV